MTKYYPKEECGITAVCNYPEASKYVYLCLHALQHRGQESSGIASTDGVNLYKYAARGKVVDVFRESKLEQLSGSSAIGHNRYSTTGSTLNRDSQPLRMETRFGTIAIAHNGNLTNSWTIRRKLEKDGAIFLTTVDTEVIAHLIARSRSDNFNDALFDALSQVKGAYCLMVLMKKTLYVVRGPNGFRPLVMGTLGDALVFASETCALDIIGAEYKRSIAAGEIIKVVNNQYRSSFPFKKRTVNMCIFELIYFSRPDSIVFDRPVYDVRWKLGELLAEESPVDADIVISVPDSSNVAALGYSNCSKIPFHFGLIRSNYVGRTFIEPTQKIRDFGAKLKYNSISSVVNGQRVIVVDDSIIRGTTQSKVISILRDAGAKEIHVRISSAPTKFPCYYGIDIPTSEELLASTHGLEDIRKKIGVDSIAYLKEETMLAATEIPKTSDLNKSKKDEDGYCLACFNGNYPVEFVDSYLAREEQKVLFKGYEIEDS